ncbi:MULTISPECIES: MG284/MPN403 family protein [unclassified Mycoplasma]|uniref:MG284/MPN403 family protein n=1 Tax=unclassified Mycoplasma TaxID=2683645 RepID=UPI00211C91D1|nr:MULTISPECIES: hypothetical protein [unclassified Mycoplasma]UUM19656.1 hypothetical protein NPA11_02700 [Mycoplasma sp. 1578d]UUM24625.1 hypothetical protein NPA12_02925 [Mycoplasma sp. 3686d]
MKNKKSLNKREKIKSNLAEQILFFWNTFNNEFTDFKKEKSVDSIVYSKINSCINKLDKIDHKILLTPQNRGDEKWYISYFSRSTYYKKRKIAVNNFLNCLLIYGLSD